MTPEKLKIKIKEKKDNTEKLMGEFHDKMKFVEDLFNVANEDKNVYDRYVVTFAHEDRTVLISNPNLGLSYMLINSKGDDAFFIHGGKEYVINPYRKKKFWFFPTEEFNKEELIRYLSEYIIENS